MLNNKVDCHCSTVDREETWGRGVLRDSTFVEPQVFLPLPLFWFEKDRGSK